MRHCIPTSLLLLLMAPCVIGVALAPPAAAQKDAELSVMQAAFTKFAQSKLVEMSESQAMARHRMHIVEENGQYLGTYHVFDPETLLCIVRRSRSKSIPFVGTMRYQVKVMQARADSMEAIDDASFSLVKIEPNTQIFSYRKGCWQ